MIDVQQTGRESILRWALYASAMLSACLLIGHLVIALWARNEFTQVESTVAIHGRMLSHGEGIYYDLKSYPFTVTPYGPVFYSLSALLQWAGVPPLLSGRVVSIASLIGILILSWWILLRFVSALVTRLVGLILVATTPTLINWATTGQVDATGLVFSVAAFALFLQWKRTLDPRFLWWTVPTSLIGLFTKQTMIAAPVTIGLYLMVTDRRRFVRWVISLGSLGGLMILLLEVATSGRFIDNAFRANLNPMLMEKLLQHTAHFVMAFGGLLIVLIAGHRVLTDALPVVVYLATSLAVLIGTSPKVGSDLNYQMEVGVLLPLCSAIVFDRLHLFRLIVEGGSHWRTLLQVPLLFQFTINLVLLANLGISRVHGERLRSAELSSLAPFVSKVERPIVCFNMNALVASGHRINVDPFLYTLLVNAGLTPPDPLLRDLLDRRFPVVILYENVFEPPRAWKKLELPSLPAAHLEAIRNSYSLVRHVPGPYLDGSYVYQPRQ